MKNSRRNKIIIAAVGILAAVIIICLVLPGSRSPAGETARKEGRTNAAETVAEETGTKHAEQEKERRTVVPETEVSTKTQEPQGYSVLSHKAIPETESISAPPKEESRETESTAVRDTEVHQETLPGPGPEPPAHVHSYELTDTRSVEHPAITEQVWVEDFPAWDEVIREGYHVCVVTCHECGAQFPDTSQGNALEAWGNHTDMVHDGDGGYDMAASYDVPAEVIRHEASGHYEERTITAAWTEYTDTYRCSCGDTYTRTR